MKKNNKKNFLKSKLFLFAILPVFALTMVFAASYIVHSFTIQSDVYEPFNVQYYIIGDHGNYDGSTTCASIDDNDWVTVNDGDTLDVQGLYPGEGRKFCVKINNAGEGDIPYTITSEVQTGHGNYNDCVLAFPETSLTGVVSGGSEKVDGQVITVPTNAPPVNDCLIDISVARG